MNGLLTVGEFLSVICLSQEIVIYNMDETTLYEGTNATAPSKFDDAYIDSAWVSYEGDKLIIQADYDIDEED